MSDDYYETIVKSLEKEDIEEIDEIIKCDYVDAELKLKLISSVLNSKPHYFKKQEPSGDLISRQAVLSYINRIQNQGTGKKKSFEFIQKFVEKLPSAEKTGHWISHREHCEMNNLIPSGLGSYFWCSECDCGIDVKEWHRNHYNYCPDCGATMNFLLKQNIVEARK